MRLDVQGVVREQLCLLKEPDVLEGIRRLAAFDVCKLFDKDNHSRSC